MAKSREEFLRSLGISAEDTLDPSLKETKFVTSYTTGSKPLTREEPPAPPPRATSFMPPQQSTQREPVSVASATTRAGYSYDDSYAAPAPPARHAQSTASSAVPAKMTQSAMSAREQFLASLQIDNMDDPERLLARDATPKGATAHAAGSRAYSGGAIGNTASQEIYRESAAVVSASLKENSVSMSPKGSFTKQLVANRVGSCEEDEVTASGSARPALKQDSIIGLRKSSKSNVAASTTPTLPDPHDDLSADDLKTLGNKHFEEGEFRKAVRLYSKAIDKDPSNAALYSNRSAAYLQASKQMGIDTRMMALRDADKVIELRPTWFKGFSRRGDALFKLDRPAEAAEAYQRGLELDEGNVNLMHSLGEAKAAAGGTKPAYASAWAPAPTRKAKNVSAHELVDELKRNMEQSNPVAKMGNDYREEALNRFRNRTTTTSSLSSFCGGDDSGRSPAPATKSPYSATPTSAKRLDRSQISEEFSSAAAHNYQQGLLDAYRKKKQMQA